jgi:hypothetical protein
VFTYKPPEFNDGPILIVCHDIYRDAEATRAYVIALADRFQAIVAAPRFEAGRFDYDRYQLGVLFRNGLFQEREQWTYGIVHRLVAIIRSREGRSSLPFYLLGHSAGGQFLERMAAFDSGSARRIVVANPGIHLFPTKDLPFGYGFGGLPDHLSDKEIMQAYLAAPLTLCLGTDDTEVDEYLDLSPPAMTQGLNRLERGRTCYEQAQILAAKRNWNCNWRLVEVAGVGHSAVWMFATDAVAQALFKPAPTTPAVAGAQVAGD